MKKNLTIKLDERLLIKGRHIAVEEDKSLSEWIGEIVASEIIRRQSGASTKKSAISFLRHGFSLSGKPLSRDETHER